MKQPLTDRQAQTLAIIRASILERGFPPTLREIGEEMSIRSTNGVSDHMKALERKGYIRRHDLKSRGVELVDLVHTIERMDQIDPMASSVITRLISAAERNRGDLFDGEADAIRVARAWLDRTEAIARKSS